MTGRFRAHLVAIALTLVTPVVARAQEELESPALAKLRAAKITFAEPMPTRLAAIRKIARDAGVTIDVHASVRSALEEACALECKELAADSALTYVCMEADAAWRADGGHVMVTSSDRLPPVGVVVVHDVRDLLLKLRDAPGVMPDFGAPAKAPMFAEDDEGRGLDDDELVNLVRDLVEPGTWDDHGFSVATTCEGSGMLVVRHRADVQRKVARFLADLGRYAAATIRVHAWLVPAAIDLPFAPGVGMDVRGWRDWCASHGQRDAIVEVLTTSYNTQRVHTAAFEQGALPEQTGAPPVGYVLDVRPTHGGGSGETWLELRIQHSRWSVTKADRLELGRLRTVVAVPAGRVVAVGGGTVEGLEGRRIVVAAEVRASAGPREDAPRPDPANAALLAALEARVTFEVEGGTSAEILAELRRHAPLPTMTIDTDIEEQAFDHFAAKDETVRAVLDRLCWANDWGWEPRQGAIYFGRSDDVQPPLATRVYDVRDLVAHAPSFIERFGTQLSTGEPAPSVLEEESRLDEDRLAELVKAGLEPTAFDRSETRLESRHGALVVVQTEKTHRAIADLLGSLRQVAARSATVEIFVLADPNEALEQAGATGGLLDAAAFDEILRAGATVAGRSLVRGRSGRRFSIFIGGQERRDESAVVERGLKLEVQPFVAADASEANLILRGEFSRFARDAAQPFETTVQIPAGKVLVIGGLRRASESSHLVVARWHP